LSDHVAHLQQPVHTLSSIYTLPTDVK
jgi:hypothetical protein